MAVAVLPVVDRDVEDLKFLQGFPVQAAGLHITLQRIPGDICQRLCRQIGIERFVAHSDDDSLFSSFPAVETGVVQTHIPGSCIGLKAVSAAPALEPDLVQLFRDADVGFKLGDLYGRFIVGQITDPHDHEFHISVLVQNVLHDHIEGCSRLEAGTSHGPGDIQGQDHRNRLRMFSAVTAFPVYFVGVQLRVQLPGLIHILRAAHFRGIDMSVPAHGPSAYSGISCKIFSSPISSAHFVPPFETDL